MKTIALINAYFGNFPEYFELFLQSARNNSSIDFFIFTDNTHYKSNGNITFINISFNDFKNRLQREIEFPICCKEPYKLVDYKPVYGCALQEWIAQYDYWGYCDTDLIFGDIRKFISDELLSNYRKLYTYGHFTLFKNDKESNYFWRKKHCNTAYRYDEAFKTPYICHFDEWGGISKYAEDYGIDQYDQIDFADINFRYLYFKVNGIDDVYIPKVFSYRNGKLEELYIEENIIKRRELMYIHFQKRKMIVETKNINEFIMVPNRFIDVSTDIDIQMIRGNSRISSLNFRINYIWDRLNASINKIRQHALRERIKRIIKQRKLRRKALK